MPEKTPFPTQISASRVLLQFELPAPAILKILQRLTVVQQCAKAAFRERPSKSPRRSRSAQVIEPRQMRQTQSRVESRRPDRSAGMSRAVCECLHNPCRLLVRRGVPQSRHRPRDSTNGGRRLDNNAGFRVSHALNSFPSPIEQFQKRRRSCRSTRVRPDLSRPVSVKLPIAPACAVSNHVLRTDVQCGFSFRLQVWCGRGLLTGLSPAVKW